MTTCWDRGKKMNSKILIVLGSPRKKGNSAILAAQVAEGAMAKGADVDSIYVNGLNIKSKKDIMENAVALGHHLAKLKHA